MKKPNFIIAGFPKCGTTSLHHYLNEHPQIFMPNLSLNFYLIPTLGINGAAIATLASLIIWNTITTVLIYSRDKIKIFLN